MMKALVTAAAAAAMLGLAACGDSAEKTGENLDSAIEEATQGEENLQDGPLESAGESIDNATGAERSGDLGDTVNDATDGNPNTNP